MPTLVGKLACSVLTALVMMRMFVISHDFQHHAILYKSIPANIIFWIYGLYMLSPASIWKRSHDYHHNHNSKLFTANIGSYPILTLEKYRNASIRERRSYLATRHPLTILFGYYSMFINGMCIQSFKSSPRRHWDSLLALLLHITAAILLINFWGVSGWLLTQFIPFFISLMIGAYLFYVQHNFPSVTFKNKQDWSYLDAALNSSSHLAMNPVMQWLSANIGFHHIHHLNSRIPFYRLPEVMAKIPALQQPKTSSFRFSDIRDCLRLKVWDDVSNQMLGFKELRALGVK
jgi:omega-6 fatty acid desaturase (delta-12 desaturase)